MLELVQVLHLTLWCLVSTKKLQKPVNLFKYVWPFNEYQVQKVKIIYIKAQQRVW